MNSGRALSALLISVILGCTLWIAQVLERGAGLPASGGERHGGEGGLAEVRVAADFLLPAPGEDYAETTGRPLFNPTRRPVPSATPTAAGGQVLPGGRYALVGVSLLPDRRIALLRDLATGKTVRIAEKDRLDGVLVASVLPYKVVLRQGGQREDLPLRIAPASVLAAPSATEPGAVAAPGAPTAPAPPPAAIPPAAPAPPKP